MPLPGGRGGPLGGPVWPPQPPQSHKFPVREGVGGGVTGALGRGTWQVINDTQLDMRFSFLTWTAAPHILLRHAVSLSAGPGGRSGKLLSSSESPVAASGAVVTGPEGRYGQYYQIGVILSTRRYKGRENTVGASDDPG